MAPRDLTEVEAEIAALKDKLAQLETERRELLGAQEKVVYKHKKWACAKKQANCIAFDPRGKYIATGDSDYKVGIWKPNGSEVCTLDAGYGAVSCVAFSPVEDLLLSGESYGAVRLWDLQSEKEVATFQTNSHIRGLCFTTDGKHALAVTTDKHVRMYDVHKKEEVKDVLGHLYAIAGVAASSSRAATIDEGGALKFWDLASLKSLGSVQHDGTIWQSVAMSPAEDLVAVGDRDGNLKFFDYEAEYRGQIKIGAQVNSVSFSPDGKNAAVGTQDNQVILVSVESWGIVKKYEGHERPVTGVAFAPDGGAFVSVSMDMTACLWPVDE